VAGIYDIIVPQEEPDEQLPPMPETITFNPLGVGAEKFPDGSVRLQFLLPGKLVLVNLPQGGADHLKAELSGGIVVPTGMPRMDTIKGG
jgi:hypothetical protein